MQLMKSVLFVDHFSRGKICLKNTSLGKKLKYWLDFACLNTYLSGEIDDEDKDGKLVHHSKKI